MDNDLNTLAYTKFLHLEVGLREFLIDLVRQYKIKNWFNDFLGSGQRESLGVIKSRIDAATTSGIQPLVSDLYYYKTSQAKKSFEFLGQRNLVCHPFYYLNWSDLEGLISMKLNVNLIEDIIGQANRKLLVELLRRLTFIRNDIAHSRHISYSDYTLVESVYNQVGGIVPEFDVLKNRQSTEKRLEVLVDKVAECFKTILNVRLPELVMIENLLSAIEVCMESFWLLTIYPEFYNDLNKLNIEILLLKEYRLKVGGVLDIQQWYDRNGAILQKLESTLSNG